MGYATLPRGFVGRRRVSPAVPPPAPAGGATDVRSARLFLSELHRSRPVEGAAALAAEVEAHLTAVHGFVSCSPDPGWLAGALRGRLLSRRHDGRPASVVYMPAKGLSLLSILRGLAIAGSLRPAELTILLTQFHPTRRMRWGLRLARFTRWHWVVSNQDQAQMLGAHRVGARVLRPRIPLSKIGTRERSAARSAVGLADDREVFLHVGHATRGRNLRALAPLARTGTLVLVLSDAFPEEVDALPTGENVVVVRGFVPALGDYYRAADVYVFPTVDARSVIGIPVSVVESLANGTPVVAVRSPMVEAWQDVPGVVLVNSEDEVCAAARAAVGRTAAAAHIPGVGECADDLEVCRQPASH